VAASTAPAAPGIAQLVRQAHRADRVEVDQRDRLVAAEQDVADLGIAVRDRRWKLRERRQRCSGSSDVGGDLGHRRVKWVRDVLTGRFRQHFEVPRGVVHTEPHGDERVLHTIERCMPAREQLARGERLLR
jgi:hypothetical protein